MRLANIKGIAPDLTGIILMAGDHTIRFTGAGMEPIPTVGLPNTVPDITMGHHHTMEAVILVKGVLAVSPGLARRALRHPHLRRKIRRLLRRQARPHLRRHLQVWDLWPHPHLRLLRRLPEGWLLRSAQRRVFRRARNAPVGVPSMASV